MDFNQHYHLAGKHAFLGASSYHWIRYTPDRLVSAYESAKARERGTMLHDWASTAIKEGIKLAKLKRAINMFVNDAIGFRMESEVVLYYSDNCFGTADAISFRDGLLRIHDLKTGVSKASFDQLLIYSALFCLEYDIDPSKIEFAFRLYQGNGFEEVTTQPEAVQEIMDKIIEFDKILDDLKTTLG